MCLAFAAQYTLSFPAGFDDREAGAFVIRVLGEEGARAETGRVELWVEKLIVDGQLVRGESLERSNNWEVISRAGSGLPAHLLYKGGPASLALQGRTLLAIFRSNEWSGVIRLERVGKGEQAVDVEASTGQGQVIVIEDPVSPTSTVVFVAALSLFAGAAWWFGPNRRGRGSLPWLIFFLSVFHILFWINQCVGTTSDSPGYLDTLQYFFRDGAPSYFPPGYPVLLGLVGSVSGESLGRWVTLIQHAMAVFVGGWIYLLLKRIIFDELALAGGLLAGTVTPIVTMSQTIMSEVPTIFAMVGALYYTVRAAETGRLLFAILAGVLTGWAGLLRVVPLVALLPSICLLLLLPWTKRGLRLCGLTVAVAAGVVLLPLSWYWYNSGQIKLSDSVGFHLFNRVVTEQKQLDEDGPATRLLLDLIPGQDPRGVAHWDIRESPGLRELSYEEAEILLRDVSLEGIYKNPVGYIVFTFGLAWETFLGDPTHWIPAWGDTISVHPRLETPPPLAPTASSLHWRWSLEGAYRIGWPVLCWAAVAGTFLGLCRPTRALALALAWTPAGYLLSSASVEYFNPRFNVPTAPFVAALSMILLSSIILAILHGYWSLSEMRRKDSSRASLSSSIIRR
ncbi:MAG TPA: glycosyltransferase family 39 protein [Blastocatellia bacterium]|nr:glycosyltransferase family 39 protein [Blastocatellia bacterium]